MPPRPYVELQTGNKGVLLAVESVAPLPGTFFPQGNTVHRYDLKARKTDVVINKVRSLKGVTDTKTLIGTKSLSGGK